MARANLKRKREEKELKDKGYVECYHCDELVKPSALKCPHCGKWYSSGKQALAVSLVLIIALSLVSVYYFYQDSQGAYDPSSAAPTVLSANPTGLTVSTDSSIAVTFSKDMDKASVQAAFSISPSIPGSFSWSGRTMTFAPTNPLADGSVYTATVGSSAVDATGKTLDCGVYTWRFTTTAGGATIPTIRTIGTGDNNFWSISTSHPSWALSEVQSRPVLILTHTTGCAPCVTMGEICEDVSSAYSSQIKYYDLTSGVNEPQATDCFAAYDPVPPNYVPLTTILTKGPNNQILWHSWEGVIDEATLSSWIDDAITYHNNN